VGHRPPPTLSPLSEHLVCPLWFLHQLISPPSFCSRKHLKDMQHQRLPLFRSMPLPSRTSSMHQASFSKTPPTHTHHFFLPFLLTPLTSHIFIRLIQELNRLVPEQQVFITLDNLNSGAFRSMSANDMIAVLRHYKRYHRQAPSKSITNPLCTCWLLCSLIDWFIGRELLGPHHELLD